MRTLINIDFLVKIRDAGQIIADAANEYLEKLGPKDTRACSWNPERIQWKSAQGSHGYYERSEDVNNPDFKELVKDLTAHQGKLTHNGFFYWLFQSGLIVGRKLRK